MPSAYQPSPKLVVGFPVPVTPVSLSRLVIPFAPKLIARSLPLRVTVAVVPGPNRLTVPLGKPAEGVTLAVPQELYILLVRGAGRRQRGRQALEHRACRGGLIEIDIEILDERAFGDALFDREVFDPSGAA